MGEETWEDVYNEPDPNKRKEIPSPAWVFETRPGIATPNSDIEALMMSTPGYEISADETANYRDRGDTYSNLEELLGVELELDEVEIEVLDATLVSGLSIREAAEILGMPATTVWRIKDSAMERIRSRANGTR